MEEKKADLCYYRGMFIQWLSLTTLLLTLASVCSASPGAYTTVNDRPQLGADETSFSFYWALWRALTPGEEQSLRAVGEGSLVSERRIDWRVRKCGADEILHTDGERFWFLDRIRFDTQGRVIPVREGARPGFRYLNMGTVNGLFLRGLPAFTPPPRRAGEATMDYRERKLAAYSVWEEQAYPRGARGEITIRSIHRLFSGAFQASDFVAVGDYRLPGSRYYDEFRKFAPDRWPVYYDERAHKPHTLREPSEWALATPLSEDRFVARLEWDWCAADRPVRAVLYVPRGGLPAGGPTRPGRPDEGTATLPIVETSDLSF